MRKARPIVIRADDNHGDSLSLMDIGRRIREAREARGLSQQELGNVFGISQPAIKKIEAGTTKKSRYLREILDYLGLVMNSTGHAPANATATVAPEPAPSHNQTSIRQVPVRGEVAAGRWFEHDELDQDEWPPIPTVPEKYPALAQFAFRVVGTSMNKKRLHAGDFAICVNYWEARTTPRSGDLVVVERREGSRIERTVKELIVNNGGFELWPRSSDPKWQTPISVPKVTSPRDADGLEIEIIGLVIGIHVPVGS